MLHLAHLVFPDLSLFLSRIVSPCMGHLGYMMEAIELRIKIMRQEREFRLQSVPSICAGAVTKGGKGRSKPKGSGKGRGPVGQHPKTAPYKNSHMPIAPYRSANAVKGSAKGKSKGTKGKRSTVLLFTVNILS